MRSLRSLIDPGGRSLLYHIDRLHHTLDTLTERLRAAVASAVAETVSGVVKDALLAAFSNQQPARSPYDPPRPFTRRTPSWDEPERREEPYRMGGLSDYDRDDEDVYDRRRYDEYDRDYDDGRERDDLRTSKPSPKQPNDSTWPHALAVGLHTAAWWLQRRSGRFSVLAAVGLGAASTAVVMIGGPWALALAGLAASALSLGGLEAALRSAISTLSNWTER